MKFRLQARKDYSDGVKITVEDVPQKVDRDNFGFEYCVTIGGFAVYCESRQKDLWSIFDERFISESEQGDYPPIASGMSKEDAINIAEFFAASRPQQKAEPSGLTLEIVPDPKITTKSL